MESLLFLLDCVGMILVCYMSMRDEYRGVSGTLTSWFRGRAEMGRPEKQGDPKQESLRKERRDFTR